MEKLYQLRLNDINCESRYKIVLISTWDSGRTKEELVEFADKFYEGVERVEQLNKTLG